MFQGWVCIVEPKSEYLMKREEIEKERKREARTRERNQLVNYIFKYLSSAVARSSLFMLSYAYIELTVSVVRYIDLCKHNVCAGKTTCTKREGCAHVNNR